MPESTFCKMKYLIQCAITRLIRIFINILTILNLLQSKLAIPNTCMIRGASYVSEELDVISAINLIKTSFTYYGLWQLLLYFSPKDTIVSHSRYNWRDMPGIHCSYIIFIYMSLGWTNIRSAKYWFLVCEVLKLKDTNSKNS